MTTQKPMLKHAHSRQCTEQSPSACQDRQVQEKIRPHFHPSRSWYGAKYQRLISEQAPHSLILMALYAPQILAPEGLFKLSLDVTPSATQTENSDISRLDMNPRLIRPAVLPLILGEHDANGLFASTFNGIPPSLLDHHYQSSWSAHKFFAMACFLSRKVSLEYSNHKILINSVHLLGHSKIDVPPASNTTSRLSAGSAFVACNDLTSWRADTVPQNYCKDDNVAEMIDWPTSSADMVAVVYDFLHRNSVYLIRCPGDAFSVAAFPSPTDSTQTITTVSHGYRFPRKRVARFHGLVSHASGREILAYGDSVWVSANGGSNFQQLSALPRGEQVDIIATADNGRYAFVTMPSRQLYYGRSNAFHTIKLQPLAGTTIRTPVVLACEYISNVLASYVSSSFVVFPLMLTASHAQGKQVVSSSLSLSWRQIMRL
eukprot:SAG31_NODE_1548_length_7914_cov_5.353423_3_plen_430_part_00